MIVFKIKGFHVLQTSKKKFSVKGADWFFLYAGVVSEARYTVAISAVNKPAENSVGKHNAVTDRQKKDLKPIGMRNVAEE